MPSPSPWGSGGVQTSTSPQRYAIRAQRGRSDGGVLATHSTPHHETSCSQSQHKPNHPTRSSRVYATSRNSTAACNLSHMCERWPTRHQSIWRVTIPCESAPPPAQRLCSDAVDVRRAQRQRRRAHPAIIILSTVGKRSARPPNGWPALQRVERFGRDLQAGLANILVESPFAVRARGRGAHSQRPSLRRAFAHFHGKANASQWPMLYWRRNRSKALQKGICLGVK